MSDLPVNRDLTADYNIGPRELGSPSKAALWTGRVLSGLAGLMLLMGGVTDIVKSQVAVEGLARAGFPADSLVPLGVVTAVSALLYLIPQTAVLGAILLTGYLGGAVATHVRMGEYGMMFAPVVFGAVVWLGLLLRDARVRLLLPLRRL